MRTIKNTLRINKILKENPEILNSIIEDRKQINELLKERTLALKVTQKQAKKITDLENKNSALEDYNSRLLVENLQKGDNNND
jgi:hypothetical protein